MLASDSSAKYARTQRTCRMAFTKENPNIHNSRETKAHTRSHQHYVKELLYLEKTLDGCLSGFHNGSFQELLSVIIFSLEKSGLCFAWYNCPGRQKPERNVKCRQNLRGKHTINGSTVILMPSFGTYWAFSSRGWLC